MNMGKSARLTHLTLERNPMHTLTMPLADAILASKALLNHVSKDGGLYLAAGTRGVDDVTPVITHAAVVDLEGKYYLVGTDRYSFGRFALGEADVRDGEWPTEAAPMIPRAALDWVAKIAVKALRNQKAVSLSGDEGYFIRWSWTPGLVEGENSEHPGTPTVEVEVAIVRGGKSERTQVFDVYKGNFPRVSRLWRDASAGPIEEVALSHLSLAKIAADLALFAGKDQGASARLQFSANPSTGKPSPVQYTLGRDDRWTAAIQPNMILR